MFPLPLVEPIHILWVPSPYQSSSILTSPIPLPCRFFSALRPLSDISNPAAFIELYGKKATSNQQYIIFSTERIKKLKLIPV